MHCSTTKLERAIRGAHPPLTTRGLCQPLARIASSCLLLGAYIHAILQQFIIAPWVLRVGKFESPASIEEWKRGSWRAQNFDTAMPLVRSVYLMINEPATPHFHPTNFPLSLSSIQIPRT
jgi:hypothetical protein